jgi:hypothetical protein
MLEHPEFVVWLSGILTAGREGENRQRAKHLNRQPVAAAMFATYQRSQSASLEFWTAVRDETDTAPTMPTRKLARYLLTVGVDSGSGASRIRTVPPREMYVKCLHAWNAWRKGETTNLNYYPDKEVPSIR